MTALLFRALVFLCLISAIATHSLAQTSVTLRPLIAPDVSGFYEPTRLSRGNAIVDDARGWIYFHGFSHVKGIPVSAVFRTDLQGRLDYSWLPKNLPGSSRVILTASGDLIGLLNSEPNPVDGNVVNGARLVRISAQPGAAKLAEYTLSVSAQPGARYVDATLVADGSSVIVGVREEAPTDGRGTLRATTLRRIDLITDTLDPNWTRSLSGDVYLDAARNSAVFTFSNFVSAEARYAELRRISFSASAAPDLTTRIANASVEKIAVDSQGRIYAIGRINIDFQTQLQIYRFRSDGVLDPTWRTDLTRAALSRASTIDYFSVVDGSLLVSVVEPPYANTAISKVARRFSDSGTVELQNRISADPNTEFFPRFAAGSQTLYSIESSSFSRLNALTLTPASPPSQSIAAGYAPVKLLIRPEADGSHVIAGQFAAWYHGTEYRHFVWLRPDGTPKLGLRASDTNAIEANFLGRAANGALFVELLETQGQPREPGNPARELSLAVAMPSASDLSLIKISAATEGVIAAAGLGADGFVYYAEYDRAFAPSIKRARIATRQVDASWQIKIVDPVLVAGDAQIYSLQVDMTGGIWLGGFDTTCFTGCFFSGLWRFDSSAVARAPEYLRDNAQPFFNPLRLTSTHAYIDRSRYVLGSTLAQDLSWRTRDPVQIVDDTYAYFVSSPFIDFDQGITAFSRASTDGDGTFDPAWRREVNQNLFPIEAITATPDGAVSIASSTSQTHTRFSVWSDRVPSTLTRSVIEFSYDNGNRFFITGRADEIAVLDSNPQLFSRTGQRFVTTEPLYRDQGVSAVCRFYVPPQSSGKSTHFYGSDQECQMVNSVIGFVYEGFDFATVKPVNGVCPSASPVAVTRMFNNKAATLEGNHRYTTSAAIKQQMLSRGWVDEGVVFCASAQ